MDINKKKMILLISIISLLILTSILSGMLSKKILLLIIIPLLSVWFILYFCWWRCPHCKRSLGRLEYGITHCKYCGKKLSKY
jgi:hypothetical protein